MPTAIRIAAPISTSIAPTDRSDLNELLPIALFSGIGLLISLVAILTGVQGAWY